MHTTQFIFSEKGQFNNNDAMWISLGFAFFFGFGAASAIHPLITKWMRPIHKWLSVKRLSTIEKSAKWEAIQAYIDAINDFNHNAALERERIWNEKYAARQQQVRRRRLWVNYWKAFSR